MNFKGKTLEEWFCSQKELKEYATKYENIKTFLNPIHDEVKTMVAKIDPTMYLNAHGQSHIKMVIDKVTMLLSHNDISLSNYEVFLLLLSIQFHDIGHIINGRDQHAENAAKILSKIDSPLLDTVEKKVIFQISSAHSGNKNPIGNLPINDTFYNESVRYRLLSALLRLGDELADGKERSSSFLLENNLIPSESKLYHAFSYCLNSSYVQLENHTVCLKFFLSKEHVINKYKRRDEEVFLIDEIYSRTLTTFIECLYYNRFVPESIRLNTVDVDINFLCQETLSDFHDRIKFRIEERGYPNLGSNNIFEICEADLVKDGQKLDGEYINSKI